MKVFDYSRDSENPHWFRRYPCIGCGEQSTFIVHKPALVEWYAGTFIQNAFPTLTPAEREHIVSGTHPECFDKLFGEEAP